MPLDLGDPNDPDWWVKAKLKRENLDPVHALPTVLGLRGEADTYPYALIDIAREECVREILTDYNHRVKVDRLRPAVGSLPPLLARTIDIDAMVEQWRELRAPAGADQLAAREAAASRAAPERAQNPPADHGDGAGSCGAGGGSAGRSDRCGPGCKMRGDVRQVERTRDHVKDEPLSDVG